MGWYKSCSAVLLVLHVLHCCVPVRTAQMPACSSTIFCSGKLLHEVQTKRLFPDSKTFVDLRMKADPSEILTKFKELGNVTRDNLEAFVKQYFSAEPENDLEAWTPDDWQSSPKFIEEIADEKLKHFAKILNQRWKELGRRIKDDAKLNTDRSSLIIIDKPFVIPGGRFREYYYWDSYWVLKGLLVCQMNNTARAMITNFLQLVNKYGFVPNGGRVYYTNRSQPPFLIPMMDLYVRSTNDVQFMKDNLATLLKEYNFWQSNRKVTVVVEKGSFDLNRYNAQMNTPRPESYFEDYETAQGLQDAEKEELYQNIASAAESGWDFSTRWFNQTDPGSKSMKSIRTGHVVPVDLNSILFMNERILERFYNLSGDNTKALDFKNKAEKRRQAIDAVLWDDATGLYLDYDTELKQRNTAFFAAAMAPLWAGVHAGDTEKEEKVINALEKKGVLKYPGGFPTSLTESGQQWDFPNAWPPLQDITIEALASFKDTATKDKAFRLAQDWVNTNWKAWEQSKAMYEKYNVKKQGDPGHGGEYKVQLGFGWTNGVILDLLSKYPKTLKAVPTTSSATTATLPSLCVLIIVALVSMFVD